MHFDVQHSVQYRFSQPVFLEPHQLRFQPRVDGAQLSGQCALEVMPSPSGRTGQLDVNGNAATFVWFDGLHESLTIRSEVRVQTLRPNPFDFLLPPSSKFERPYADVELDWLRPMLRRAPSTNSHDGVRALADELAAAADRQIFAFLENLNDTLNDRLKLIHRELGDPYTPEETLRRGEGACRDIAVLFIDACRSVGLAARFISGYHLGSDQDDEHDLHAWAEVYIPNGGWRGFDPSSGLLAADCHIPVASSPCSRGTLPVCGSFRGTSATAEMETSVRVSVLDEL